MNERLLDVKEVGELLSINPFSVYRMALKGQLKSVKLGKLRRFRESDIQVFIEKLSDKKKGVSK